MKKGLMFALVFFVGILTACTKPVAPPDKEIIYSATFSSVEIIGDDRIEYSIDDGNNWVSGGQIVFDNLTPGTEYTISYRYKRVGKAEPSEIVTKKVMTLDYVEEGSELDKILVIGNENSIDALAYFYDLVIDNNIEKDLIIGSVTLENATLETFTESNRTYEYVKVSETTGVVKNNDMNLSDVIQDETWDLIIIEQSSGLGGILKDYSPHLNNLLDLISTNGTNENVQIAFQMPWSFSRNSKHEAFVKYRSDQERMYKNIADRMSETILTNDSIDVLIPSGTVIQNLRTTVIGDDLTLADGLRLNNIGQLAITLTWIKQLYGTDLMTLDLAAIEEDEDIIGAINESIDNAVLAPTEVTRSVNFSNPYKDKLYMLSIGNSFTQDAYVYMAQMLMDIGIKDFVIGYLYIGGSSLNTHISGIENNREYDQYRIWNNSAQMTEINTGKTVVSALSDYEWDVITIQQVSSDSGVALSLRAITPLMDLIKANNPNHENTKYGYHMTWAYTDHWEFGRYNKDQAYMYQRIVEATKEVVVPHKDIDFIIPAGTAIQNLRNTTVGDNVTRDGYHLNGLGQYTAGMMWVKTLTNSDLDAIKYQPVSVNVTQNIALIKRAVDDAYYNPYELSN